jgi:hypothetical protein
MKQNFSTPDSGKQAVPPIDTAASVSAQQLAQPRFMRLPKPGTLCPLRPDVSERCFLHWTDDDVVIVADRELAGVQLDEAFNGKEAVIPGLPKTRVHFFFAIIRHARD